MILELIKTNWSSILIVLFVISIILVLLKTGNKDIVMRIVGGLVVEAEKELGSGTGPLKYDKVVEKLYSLPLPWVLKMVISLFSKKEINDFIEAGVEKLNKTLNTGATLTGYDDEKFLNSNIINEDIKLTEKALDVEPEDTEIKSNGPVG